MTRTLNVETTVLPGHRIEIVSPELPEGSRASVQVTVPTAPPTMPAAHPDLAAAERFFLTDLPRLLTTCPGRWVAYSGAGRLAEGDEPIALHRRCLDSGLEPGRFLVARVEPDLPVAEMSQNWFPPED